MRWGKSVRINSQYDAKFIRFAVFRKNFKEHIRTFLLRSKGSSSPDRSLIFVWRTRRKSNWIILWIFATEYLNIPVSQYLHFFSSQLTDKCKKALSRIFKLIDHDNDGVLSDSELNRFQRRCFNSPLQQQALEDVKNIVKRSVPDGIFDNGITLSGFLYLHCLFIQRGRHETTWTVLRKFGYTDSLELSDHYLNPPFEIPIGSSCELTLSGLQFITQLFSKYDLDQDSLLSPAEIKALFKVCPSVPIYFLPEFYLESVPLSNEKGWLDLQSFKSLWV